jgi:hypothetical protein
VEAVAELMNRIVGVRWWNGFASLLLLPHR